MPGYLIEHVVKETKTGYDVRCAIAINIQFYFNLCFMGIALMYNLAQS